MEWWSGEVWSGGTHHSDEGGEKTPGATDLCKPEGAAHHPGQPQQRVSHRENEDGMDLWTVDTAESAQPESQARTVGLTFGLRRIFLWSTEMMMDREPRMLRAGDTAVSSTHTQQ